MYSFPDFEPFCCSTSSSNCCFLTCIQVSQESGQVVWYSHLFQNVPVCCDPQSQASASSVKEKWVFFWSSPAFSMVRWQPEPVSAALPRALSHSSPAPLCDPMHCGPPGSSVHGILQARILGWVTMPSSRRSSPPKNRTWSPPSPALQADSLPLAPPRKPPALPLGV